MSDDENLITVDELCTRIRRQCETMSRSNPNRTLLEQCLVAIINLASRLPHQPGGQQSKGGIWVP